MSKFMHTKIRIINVNKYGQYCSLSGPVLGLARRKLTGPTCPLDKRTEHKLKVEDKLTAVTV